MTNQKQSGSKREVNAERRRRSNAPEGQQRRQAPAPQRRDRQGQPTGSSSGQRPPGNAGLLGALTGGKLPGWAVVLILIAFVLFYLFSGGGDDDGVFNYDAENPGSQPVGQVSEPTRQPTIEFIPPVAATDGPTWLVMLYQDADDKILEQDILLDLNEAERIGSSANVHIVTQIDRFNGGYQGDGDWTSAKRFYLTQDNDLQRINSEEIADLGEVNMSDGQTLIDFVTWSVENFPADNYVLILSDHGMGWPGGWSDPAPGGRGDPSIPLAARLGDELYLMELDQALATILAQTGIEKFELIGMDACLMGHLEVFSALAPYARYAVASQETEPALGWAYTGFLQDLVMNPNIDGAALGELIVNTYIQGDQRIVDDQARADFLRQGSPVGSLFDLLAGGSSNTMSAGQLAQQMAQGITLTAADLQALPVLIDSLNEFSLALQSANQSTVAQARTYAQSFTSVFGREVPPSYIDLGNYIEMLLQQSNDRSLADAGEQVIHAIEQVVVAERHGPKKPGATGISIYFPNSKLYNNPITGPASYTAIAERFANISLWDEFLAFHYTGNTFDADTRGAVIPAAGTPVRAPGGGEIAVSPIRASSQSISIGQSTTLSIDIDGENIGYILLFVGYYDSASNSIYMIDTDYLESDQTQEIGGVYYPDWGQGEFTMSFTWEPVVYAINDGSDFVVSMLNPESYGATYEQAVYTADGMYAFADGSPARYARLYFRNGVLRQAYGFTGQEGTGSPREIIPQPGDQFTIIEKWLDLGPNGEVVQTAAQDGGTLTFGSEIFTWEELDAAPGNYIVGFVIEDLDGNPTQVFTQITVE